MSIGPLPRPKAISWAVFAIVVQKVQSLVGDILLNSCLSSGEAMTQPHHRSIPESCMPKIYGLHFAYFDRACLLCSFDLVIGLLLLLFSSGL